MFTTDCHSHVLPGIDDGARNVQESIAILKTLASQGVDTVAATPHFRGHRDDVRAFCRRRKEAFDALCREAGQAAADMVILGAEVALEYGLSETDGLRALCYEFSNYLLLELPYRPFALWMLDEIMNIACENDVIPVIAHVDRYHELFSKDDYEQIFSMRGVLFQVNNEAFKSRGGRKVVDRMIKMQLPFVLGSDSHNMTNRMPNFDLPAKSLKKYQVHPEALRFLRIFR